MVVNVRYEDTQRCIEVIEVNDLLAQRGLRVFDLAGDLRALADQRGYDMRRVIHAVSV